MLFFLYLKRYCKSGFCYISHEGQKIYHKGLKFCITLISFDKCEHFCKLQPEWFHWAHCWWPFYTHCTSCTRFRSWSFYRYRKCFGDLDQWPWQVEKKHRKSMAAFHLREFWKWLIVYDNKNLHITELEETWPVFILFISNKIERPGSKKLIRSG